MDLLIPENGINLTKYDLFNCLPENEINLIE